ncbi:hypothetical protein BGZ68_001430 [Mortierella alpina]|nr:hypothetical protein BGZ68_001430 [Mortierella alpina]
MAFRRPSEGKAHAVLRCIGLLIVNLGLFAFAVYNIILLFRYEFFLQSAETLVTEENPLVEMPDILVCMSSSLIWASAMNWYTNGAYTDGYKGPNITMISHNGTDIYRNGPCDTYHRLLSVISLNGEKVNRTMYTHLLIPIGTNPFAPANDTTDPSFVIALPHQNNPYLQDKSTWPPRFKEKRDVADNLYAVTNARQQARLRTTITKTWYRRNDFVGLWGYFKDEPGYSVATRFALYNMKNNTGSELKTEVLVTVPVSSIEQSQVLIQTFQSAFSSWGGAFGVAWGFFYFLFGTPSTKRVLAERYFAEKKDSSLNNNNNNNNKISNGGPSTKGSTRGNDSKSALSNDYNNSHDDLEAQEKKDGKYRDLEARIISLEAVLDDFYLDLSPFRKEKEEEQKKSQSWYRRTFSSKAKDEKDGTFVQIEDMGRKTSYESESYRMGQVQRDRSA